MARAGTARDVGPRAVWDHGEPETRTVRPGPQGADMSKRARKRRARKKNGANHGKKPNA